MAYDYSQTVRCGGCGTHLRIKPCDAPRPIVPSSVQVCWYQHQ